MELLYDEQARGCIHGRGRICCPNRQVALVRADAIYRAEPAQRRARGGSGLDHGGNALVKRESAVAPELAQMLCSPPSVAGFGAAQGICGWWWRTRASFRASSMGRRKVSRAGSGVFANELGVALKRGTHEGWPRASGRHRRHARDGSLRHCGELRAEREKMLRGTDAPGL